ncbi:GDP-L-fucose synthase family protein [Agrobacterium larrymoorei]|uniref:GDP-L-fucose synthase n=1 Tax=Agrobacterium larrymoorei TaxID=160699 RepID=A0ABU0UNM5_9HYPH|nr:GDP-L-fucose synthase [Agrobacterium larrymoorei]MDQ1186566.1 GDP-L-fucose synthase [Agrobacterium larrymoorei]
MKILLSGGRGMVGRNILEQAEKRGAVIHAPTSDELDLTNATKTIEFIDALKPNIVIHAAGRVGGIQANIREPVRFLTENWSMGENIVRAARAAGVKRLINLGSSCMYPRGHMDPLKEDMVLAGPLEPTNEGYAIAKCAVARLCEYVTREDGEYQYKTVIPCNLYGRFDKFDPAVSHMIPAVIHKLHSAKECGAEAVDIWGDGNARREFMFAEDLAEAIFFALDHFEALPALTNIGLGYDYTINEYYAAAAEVIGFEGSFVHDLSKPVGMARKLLDVTRQTELGWVPRTKLHDGIRKTYDYYLSKEVQNVLSAR